MENEKLDIKIPDPYLESMKIVQDQIGDIKKSFNWGLSFIVGVLVLGFLSLLFMVVGIVVDTWRFNSTIYKENATLELNSKIIQNDFDKQQEIIKRLEKIEAKIKYSS